MVTVHRIPNSCNAIAIVWSGLHVLTYTYPAHGSRSLCLPGEHGAACGSLSHEFKEKEQSTSGRDNEVQAPPTALEPSAAILRDPCRCRLGGGPASRMVLAATRELRGRRRGDRARAPRLLAQRQRARATSMVVRSAGSRLRAGAHGNLRGDRPQTLAWTRRAEAEQPRAPRTTTRGPRELRRRRRSGHARALRVLVRRPCAHASSTAASSAGMLVQQLSAGIGARAQLEHGIRSEKEETTGFSQRN